mgnify:CR=1 FL=1
MTQPSLVKCRFCSWTTPRFRTWKGGRRTSGPGTAYLRLQDHIQREHPAEWAEVEEYLDLHPTRSTR